VVDPKAGISKRVASARPCSMMSLDYPRGDGAPMQISMIADIKSHIDAMRNPFGSKIVTVNCQPVECPIWERVPSMEP